MLKKFFNNQKQSSGDNSTNIQQNTTNIIITEEQYKEIMLENFKKNFLEFNPDLQKLILKRVDEFTYNYLQESQRQNVNVLTQASDVGFNCSLYTAQKEYAKNGNSDLGKLLVDILVQRTKEESKSLRKIVLDEALNVVNKITTVQLFILATIFLIKYTKFLNITSIDEFKKYWKNNILYFADNLPNYNLHYNHLVYCGCCEIQITSLDIFEVLRNNYPGVLTEGFTEEQLTNSFKESGELEKIREKVIPCLNNASLLQFNATDFDILNKNLNFFDNSKDVENFWKKYLMNNEQVENMILNFDKRSSKFLESWKNTHIKSIDLTSVGIAIAHSFVKSQLDNFGDLSIWIKE